MTDDLLDPAILSDIAAKMEAIQQEMAELSSRKESTPASERTPEWESDEKRMTACLERLSALGQRWSQLNAALDNSEPASNH